MGIEQDGDTEPLLQSVQFSIELAMVGVPVGIEPAAHLDRIRFASVAVERGEIKACGRTQLSAVAAAMKCVSLGITVEIDDVARLRRGQEPNSQGRCEIVKPVQMPV